MRIVSKCPQLALLAVLAGASFGIPFNQAHAAGPSLERLFDKGQYPAFLAQAQDAATRDDVDALFLLGKAYHLGSGVGEDIAVARGYYERARTLGSARASHNLGLLALDKGDTKQAIDLLEEALARGLRMPTLFNLAHAYTPPDPTSVFGLHSYIDRARTAADYFAKACGEEDNEVCREDAARQYLRAYMMALQANGVTSDEVSALREQALVWLRKGMDAGSGTAWTNYGALLLNERDYEGARKAFQQGVELNVPAAHYHLAELAAKGQGQAERDRDLALQHYEQAAALGMEQAKRPAFDLLLERLEWEDDLARLEQGVDRLRALQPEPSYKDWSMKKVTDRLAWGRFLADEQAAVALPPQADVKFELDACGLGLAQEHGEAYNIGEHSRWRLVAYPSLGEIERLPLSGEVDAQGCVRLTVPADDAVYGLLQRQAVFALAFPNYSLPLALTTKGQTLTLSLRPVGTLLPPN
jgi:TPR repeat protein